MKCAIGKNRGDVEQNSKKEALKRSSTENTYLAFIYQALINI